MCHHRRWSGVNFINILHAKFLFEHLFCSFSLVTRKLKKVPKRLLHIKLSGKMLMKLLTECSVREEGMGTSQISAKVSYLLPSLKFKPSLLFFYYHFSRLDFRYLFLNGLSIYDVMMTYSKFGFDANKLGYTPTRVTSFVGLWLVSFVIVLGDYRHMGRITDL